MRNNQTVQLASEVVQEEIRKGNLIKYKDVLTLVPKTINSTTINRPKMHKAVENSLFSRNLFNRFFNLFGIQVINKEKTINRIVDSVSPGPDNSSGNDVHLLSLNSEEYAKAITNLAQKLSELENKATVSFNEEKKRGDDLFFRYEKLLKEYNELTQISEMNNNLVAQRIQYILSLNGKDNSANEQLIELLKDINIDAHWDSDHISLTDASMFSEFAINDEAMTGTKPCLIRNGSVYLKGVRFIKK